MASSSPAPAVGRSAAVRGAERKETFIYNWVGGLEIKADVYRPEGFAGPRSRPRMDPRMRPLMFGKPANLSAKRSAQERHAGRRRRCRFPSTTGWPPNPKLPDYRRRFAGCAFRWVRGSRAPPFFSGGSPANRIGGGRRGSAGPGHLTQAAGFRVTPRRLRHRFRSLGIRGSRRPLAHWIERTEPGISTPKGTPALTRDRILRADRGVSGPPVSDPAQRPEAGAGEAYYLKCRREGTWPRAVSGWDPRTQAERFYPYMALKHVTAGYPPTLLIHGLSDTDVPSTLSVMMAAELQAKHGVEHRLITDPDADHSSNWSPDGEEPPSRRRAIEFIRAHLN